MKIKKQKTSKEETKKADNSSASFGLDSCSMENNTIFRELFENIKSSVVIFEVKNNGNDFYIKDLNPSAEKLEKIEKNKIIGRNVKEIFPGVEEMGILDIFKKVYKTGKADDFPLKLYRDEKVSSWRSNLVFKLSSGEIMTIYDDLTAQKKIEEIIKLDEEKFEEIFNYSPIAIELYNAKGELEKVNKATLEMFGVKNEKEIIGFKLFNDPNIPGDVKRKLKKGTIVKYEVVFDFKKVKKFDLYGSIKKETVYLNVVITPIKKGSGGYLAMIEDITGNKDSEIKLREKLEEMEKLNRLMVGRELKMIELKEKINNWEKRNENSKK